MTDDLRILTLVGGARDGRHVLPDGNDFLQQVKSMLERGVRRQPDARAVQSIRSVNEVWPAVQAFQQCGRGSILLQLVGHGRPGELELAFSWDRCYRDELRFYLLDNNSRALQLLARCRGLVSEVRLVACEVGTEEGHPLMFTLSKLLDCTVTAALGSVEPRMFRAATGLFSGPMARCARGTQQFSVVRGEAGDSNPRPDPRRRRALDARCWLEPRALHFVRACSADARRALALTEVERRTLLRRVAPLSLPEQETSSPELELEVSVCSIDGEASARLALLPDRTGRLFADRERNLRSAVSVELDEPTLAELLARYCAA